MRPRRTRMLTLIAAFFVLAVASLPASTVSQFNLAEMSQRAQKIYVGTVRSATEGTIEVGGGQLAIVTYHNRNLGSVTSDSRIPVGEEPARIVFPVPHVQQVEGFGQQRFVKASKVMMLFFRLQIELGSRGCLPRRASNLAN